MNSLRCLKMRPSMTPSIANIHPWLQKSILGKRSVHYLNVSDQAFKDRMKIKDGKLVLVDFYADWCGPCKTLSPLLIEATSNTKYSNGKEVDLMTIDTDEHTEVASQLQVRALPTVVAFRDGEVVDRFVGAYPMTRVQDFLEKNTS